MRFAAALFDLDDTLHDDTKAYRRAAERAALECAAVRGIDGAALYDAYVSRAENFWRDLSPATLRTSLSALRATMWAQALAACGVHDAALGRTLAESYNRYRASELELWPGVLEMLARLRAAGLKIGIVTNGFAETHREKVELLGLASSVDGLFVADEVGTVKPDPAFFLHAAGQLGVDPHACVVIGDRYDRDIAGAHAAGMYGIWLDVRGDGVPSGSKAPNASATLIADVEALILRGDLSC